MTFVACLFLSIGMALAQSRISGKVTSAEDGHPVVGATIKVVGSKTASAITDVDGNFSISVPAGSRLEVTYIGMVPKTVKASSNMSIELNADSHALDDVIVVGYGTTRREAKTGSITSVSSKELADVPATSFDKMLAGKMAGVSITQTTGQPGSNSQIRIRGISSISAGNEPLYVVDGLPITSGDDGAFTNSSNALSAINPDDIESITVLKDAAAASVYGSRAANGVILITTKSGKEGKSHLTARAKFGISQLANDNNYGVMNAQQLLEYERTAIRNAGMNPDNPANPANAYRPMSILQGPLYNWMDAVTRNGKMQDYELTLSGGSARTKYYNSLNYQKTEGVFPGFEFSRINFRVNADHEINRFLKTGARINAGYSYSEDVPTQDFYYSNPIFTGMTMEPWQKPFNEDGTPNVNLPTNSNTNPLATAMYDDQWSKRYAFNGSVYLEWKPIKQLTFKTTDGAELSFINGRRYWSPLAHTDQKGTGTLQTDQMIYRSFTTSNTATYQDQLGKHYLRVLLGQEANYSDSEENFERSQGLDPQIPYHVSGNSTNDIAYGIGTVTMMSWFGIADYNFDNRYFIQASLRSDGSSIFGKNSRWGTFWSVGTSWNIHNEKFMESAKDWLQVLKLRASYGINGNDNIKNYLSYGTYTQSVYNGITGLRPDKPANPDLSWEKNKSFNVGLDFHVLKRLSGSIDFYTRKTTDMLLAKSQSSTSGFNSMTTNIGSLRNTGVEFQLNASIIDSKDWKWDMGFNISHNQSKVLELAGEDYLTYGDGFIRHFVGEKLYTFYLRDYYGVNPVNGEALWRTEDGSLSNNVSNARYVKCGSPEPTYAGGINTTVSWRNLTLSVVTEFKGGNKVLIADNNFVNSDGSRVNMNQSVTALNYWKKPGDTGCNPKPIYNNSTSSSLTSSTRYLEKGDYFRIKDVTLSYSFDRSLLSKIGLQGARVYTSALNLYTFHNVNFWDPERGVDGLGQGIYPVTKTFMVGLDITL